MLFLFFPNDYLVMAQPDESSQIYEIVNVFPDEIKIMNHEGIRKTIKVDSDFTLYRLIENDKKDIKMGDLVIILGHNIGSEKIRAHVIKRVPATIDDNSSKNRIMSNIECKVVATDPLSIKNAAGQVIGVELQGFTRIIQENPISIEHLKVGDKVRLFFDRLVVVARKAKDPFDDDPDEQSLLPDLSQRINDDDGFIYGIWLGRGLYTAAELKRAFRLAKNLGIRHFKVEFKWDFIEPQNNQWLWENKGIISFELVAELAQRYRLSIIPYFSLFMPWGDRAYPDPAKGECEGIVSRFGQYQAPDSAEYAEYVFNIVDKLIVSGVNVQYVELDNEASAMSDGHRSWSCFRNISAKALKVAENAAYDKIKMKYPKVMVSSTTFNAPGLAMSNHQLAQKFNARLNQYVKTYFEDTPRPKFDFLGLHEIFPGSGNPFSTAGNMKADGQYLFSSYFYIYDIWREILDKYGYADTPIFTSESTVVLKGRQDAQLLQKVIFARINAKRNKVIGWVLSQLSGSKKFTEGLPLDGPLGVSVGIARLGDSFDLKEGYYAFYTMMETLARYPRYEGRIMGETDNRDFWVEKFGDQEHNHLYVAFIPYGIVRRSPQRIQLNVGSERMVTIIRSNFYKSHKISGSDGYLNLSVNESPVFVEVGAIP